MPLPSNTSRPRPIQPLPQAPAAQARARGAGAINAPVFPPPDPADFTAASPTKDVVDAFLHANWG